MKQYLVTVERLMINDKVYRTDKLRIQAHCPEEAQSIVHNHEKGITISVICGKKKGFVHGTGHTPIREIVRKITEMVYHEH